MEYLEEDVPGKGAEDIGGVLEMRYLSGEQEKEAMFFIDKVADVAKSATCLRAKCGAIIVKNNEVIAEGINTPPAEKESQRLCLKQKDEFHKKVTDKTCCVHAEQRAIVDALKNSSDKINGSRLYFIRLDKNGNKTKAGKPYCTHCSKLALDVGIAEFVLWREKGVCIYDTEEYNRISFEYDDSKGG